ncbi:histidine phosphatase family protein [Devosia sediminis]|uniref:Histidine phosphatase family protein n=1 Tax=Devosia sediminis TaxID=2798801 RepID=A0A934MJ97_9HYPH|nr:histidine phosphatase family protein [Devosia sediminis]MBJ3783828.1 histidine phosphatase family protein [Devosia sediminis]
MKRLLLVRHGESEWNASRRLQGQADIGLSERGREQALALAPVIAQLAPDRTIVSDLRRARDTADLLGCKDAQPHEGLREIDVGEWTGRAIADIIADDPEGYRGWRAGSFAPPRGEIWQAFADRTAKATLDGFETAERLLVVCHGGVIRALLQTLLGLPPKRIIPVGPASVTVLANRPGETEMRLEVFNFSPQGPMLDAPD